MSFPETSPKILEQWEQNKEQFKMLLREGEFYNAFALSFLLGANDHAVRTVLQYGYITNEFCKVVEKLKKHFPVPDLTDELDKIVLDLKTNIKERK
jgi:hypothetical protein